MVLHLERGEGTQERAQANAEPKQYQDIRFQRVCSSDAPQSSVNDNFGIIHEDHRKIVDSKDLSAGQRKFLNDNIDSINKWAAAHPDSIVVVRNGAVDEKYSSYKGAHLDQAKMSESDKKDLKQLTDAINNIEKSDFAARIWKEGPLDRCGTGNYIDFPPLKEDSSWAVFGPMGSNSFDKRPPKVVAAGLAWDRGHDLADISKDLNRGY